MIYEHIVKLKRGEAQALQNALPSTPENYPTMLGLMLFLALFRVKSQLLKKLSGMSSTMKIKLPYEQVLALMHFHKELLATDLDIEIDSDKMYSLALLSEIKESLPDNLKNVQLIIS